MRIRREHTWTTKKEIRSFVRAWADCIGDRQIPLTPWQKKALKTFMTWVINKDGLVKSFVYNEVEEVCQQLGIVLPDYKINDAYYIYWKDENKRAQWNNSIVSHAILCLGKHGHDLDSVAKLLGPESRDERIGYMTEDMTDLMIEMAEEIEALKIRVSSLEEQINIRKKPNLSLV